MSDSLDDFFAKKDKKKKGKSKLTNNDLVTTEEVKETKKPKKKSKESEAKPAANSEPASEQTSTSEQTEEWSEYVEEKETDYSGLRIQAIQIRDEDQDQGDKDKDKGQDGDDEEGEEGSETTSTGVWSAVPQQPSQQAAEPVEPPPKKEEPAPPPARTGGYVIPSKRSGASGIALDPMPTRQQMRRKKEAPNLKSEEDFPTLGGEPPVDAGGAWGSGRFEKVRSGGRVEDQSNRGPKLELGNKYDALRGGGD